MKILQKYRCKILTVALLLVIGVLFSRIDYKSNKSICPDDFKDTEQEIASFHNWLEVFVKNNPEATMTEMSRARVDFWIDNDCKEALRRYADSVANGGLDLFVQNQ